LAGDRSARSEERAAAIQTAEFERGGEAHGLAGLYEGS
jgi:hypothetical protein